MKPGCFPLQENWRLLLASDGSPYRTYIFFKLKTSLTLVYPIY